ncbi:MAG: hypothetical protein JNJ63_11275 [Hyphomonadaceae bacterium]|nr:hypothetical protein [Hyphomonadaceae bacterium]
MSEGNPQSAERNEDISPRYLIEMFEPRTWGHSVSARMEGAGAAAERLDWQVRDSVADMVQTPIHYISTYTPSDVLPDVFRHNEVLVVSSRMRDAIEPWLKDFEFLPVEIHLSASRKRAKDWGKGPVLGDYWWLNSWCRLDLVDWEKSDMIASLPRKEGSPNFGSPVRAINWKRLVLKNGMPKDEHFFGLAYVAGERRYLSDELRRHLLSQDLRIFFRPRMAGLLPWRSPYEIERELNQLAGGSGQ